MKFSIHQSISVLEKTPWVVEQLIYDLPEEWIISNEGGETWSPFDIVGHLIHGERTDWIARLEIILSDKAEKNFTTFDRFAQFRESKGKTLKDLLDEFKSLRAENIKILKSKNLTEKDFHLIGVHPVFGNVTLKNLIATWVVHDLDHLSQLSRVMAHQFRVEVGPWKEYLRILNNFPTA